MGKRSAHIVEPCYDNSPASGRGLPELRQGHRFFDERPKRDGGRHRLRPNDMSLCIYVGGHIAAFTETLGLRRLTSDELHQVTGDHRIVVLKKARQKL